MFTQQHYQAIANEIGDIAEGDLRVVTAIRFAAMFQKDNPRFKHDKFMKACRVVPADNVSDHEYGREPAGIGKTATINGQPIIQTAFGWRHK